MTPEAQKLRDQMERAKADYMVLKRQRQKYQQEADRLFDLQKAADEESAKRQDALDEYGLSPAIKKARKEALKRANAKFRAAYKEFARAIHRRDKADEQMHWAADDLLEARMRLEDLGYKVNPMAAKKATKKPSAKQLAARRKFAAAAKARGKAAKKRNGTVIKAKRIEHLDVSKIHSLGAVPNPARAARAKARKNPALEILREAKPAKRGNQQGWLLGKEFIAKGKGTKKLPGGALFDTNAGFVYRRVENPKRKKNIAGFMQDGVFHPIRSGIEQRTTKSGTRRVKSKKAYKPSKVGEKFTYSPKKSAKRASQTKRMKAATAQRKATTTRLATRSLQRSYPLKGKRNPNDAAKRSPQKQSAARKRNIQFMTGDGYPMRASWDYDPVRAGEGRTGRADYFSRPHVIGGKKISGAKLKQLVEKKQREAVARAEERLKKARASRDDERIEKAKDHLARTRAKVRAAKTTSGAIKSDKETEKKRTQRRQLAAEKAQRKATTTRLASRSLQRSVPLKRKRRNPNDAAKAGYESFQGKTSTKSTALNFPNGTPANVYKLGSLHSITLADGRMIKPAGKAVWLCADTKGKLHLGTTGERLTNAPKGSLGRVKEVEYITSKPHLGDSKPARYFHQLGEETGEKPTLYSDGNGGLVFKGGAYSITSRGILN